MVAGLFLLSAIQKRSYINTIAHGIYLLPIQGKVDGIGLWVSTSLWGNRMDLSLWPATSSDCTNNKSYEKRSDAAVINLDVTKSKENLLCDDLNDIVQILLSDMPCQQRRVDIVVDNAGFEVGGEEVRGMNESPSVWLLVCLFVYLF